LAKIILDLLDGHQRKPQASSRLRLYDDDINHCVAFHRGAKSRGNQLASTTTLAMENKVSRFMAHSFPQNAGSIRFWTAHPYPPRLDA
jgi:hypothetical protein